MYILKHSKTLTFTRFFQFKVVRTFQVAIQELKGALKIIRKLKLQTGLDIISTTLNCKNS